MTEARQTKTCPANPDDIRQARRFLEDLPPACDSSYYSVAPDHTVVIHYACSDSDKSTRGEVRIKDGIVTNLR